MCGGKPKGAAPAKDPAWKTASAKNTADRGGEPGSVDGARRIGATATPGGTLGGSGSAAPVTSSVLGG